MGRRHPALGPHALGQLSGLQVHHIFPKARLYEADYPRGEVNAIANFCFLTQATNLDISAKPPEVYMAEILSKHPGALESQWVPTDPELWKIANYPAFLAARRELLASATNNFLTSLTGAGPASEAVTVDPREWTTPPEPVVSSTLYAGATDEREAEVQRLCAWLVAEGYAQAETDVEVTDPETGQILAVAEAFWPNGLQEGIGDPVVLDLDTETLDGPRLETLGYSVFTSCRSLREFVQRVEDRELGESGADAPLVGVAASALMVDGQR